MTNSQYVDFEKLVLAYFEGGNANGQNAEGLNNILVKIEETVKRREI